MVTSFEVVVLWSLKLTQEIITFGAGCFWGPELVFGAIQGVSQTAVGYMGGHLQYPRYTDVCRGDTGHVEVVQVYFDSSIVPHENLFATFWDCHNPTHINRQGPDIGTQYKSVIFYHTDFQKTSAQQSMESLKSSETIRGSIATEIRPAEVFWPAEDYHQKYLQKKGLASCQL